MSFLLYDLGFLIVFSLLVAAFLYYERKKLVREGPLFLYKTKIGLEIIEFLGKRYKKTLKFLSYIIVISGYILMAVMLYLLYIMVSNFMSPEFVKLVKIPPLMPLIPYLPELFRISWLPPFYFTYWIVALAIVAIAHEGFHGIFARFYNIRIKSTGFGFLGPFLAFFVEQDDKQMQKAKTFPQLTILAAGVFANILCVVIFFFAMVLFFNASYVPAGAMFSDYTYSAFPVAVMANATITTITDETLSFDGLNFTRVSLENKSYFISNAFFSLSGKDKAGDSLMKFYWDEPAINNRLMGTIIQINGVNVVTSNDFRNELVKYSPGDIINLKTRYTNGKETSILDYSFAMGKDYNNESRGVIGTASISGESRGIGGFMYKMLNLFREPATDYQPKSNSEATIFFKDLLWWIVIISLSVALTNMLPVGIFDGGRFFYLTILAITGSKKVAEVSFKWATRLLLFVFFLLMVLWAIGTYF